MASLNPVRMMQRYTRLSRNLSLNEMYEVIEAKKEDYLKHLCPLMEKVINLFGADVIKMEVGIRSEEYKAAVDRHDTYERMEGGVMSKDATPFSISASQYGIVIEAPGRTWHLREFESGEILIGVKGSAGESDLWWLSLRSIAYYAVMEGTSIESMVEDIYSVIGRTTPYVSKRVGRMLKQEAKAKKLKVA